MTRRRFASPFCRESQSEFITMPQADFDLWTRSRLAALARARGVPGWRTMRKADLIEALRREPRRVARTSHARSNQDGSPLSTASLAHRKNGPSLLRNGHSPAGSVPARVDRVIVTARSPWWLQVDWRVSPQTWVRAEAALGPARYGAVAVLRVFRVTCEDDKPSAQTWVQDLTVPPDANTWFVEAQSGQTYRMQLGLRTPDGRFQCVSRSQPVTVPEAARLGLIETDPQLIPTLPLDFQPVAVELPRRRRSRRRAANGQRPRLSDGCQLSLETELIVRGSTHPEAQLTLSGRPISVQSDGRFALHLSLPAGRQVLPATVVTPDGTTERTVIVTVESNLRALEPRLRDEL